MSSFVEQRYQARMDSLSSKERVARCVTMLKWTRDLLAWQLLDELGEMSAERLKWEVTRRMYGATRLLEPSLIESSLMFPVEAFQNTLCKVAEIFRRPGVRFHLTGGVTSVLYGGPRMTQNIDIVADNRALQGAFAVEDCLRAQTECEKL